MKKLLKQKSIYHKSWYLYILLCENGNYYTGITRDLDRRLKQHTEGKGAKYTRANQASKFLFTKKYPNHSRAAQMEAKIKRLKKLEKLAFIAEK
ncbi:MAG: GIY-YIG nuclease family protein [Candidatus Doudnabacteria bacterium]|nr:GIY-YIG nuclease family protein [Candidatus Doudnabacteria bacterium]